MKVFYEFKAQHAITFPSEISKQYENSKKAFDKRIKQDLDILNSLFPIEISYQESSPSKRLFDSSFESKFTDLSSISADSDEEIKTSIQATDNIITLIIVNFNQESIISRISSVTEEGLQKVIKKVGNYFNDITNKFKENFKTINGNILKLVFKNFKPRQQILAKFKEITDICEKLEMTNFSSNIKDSILYFEMTKQVSQKIMEVKKDLIKSNFIVDTKNQNTNERQAYYQAYNDKLKMIQSSKTLSSYLDNNSIDIIQIFHECEDDLNKKISDIKNNAIEILKKNKLYQNDCQDFSQNYKNLLEIINYLELKSEKHTAETKSVNDALNQKIIQMIVHTKKDTSDINTFRDNIIDIKLLSEHINDFKFVIDKHIDSLLQYYKDTKGAAGATAIAQLGIILDKDPLGKNIVLEHKIFEGFALALFNTKTSINGLDYILQHIEGDDIRKDRLKKYLKEPINVTPLIKEVITLTGKQNLSSSEVKWGGTTIQKIPEIMAYVFAIWTLQNSDNYFNAKGVENQNFYLLQPLPAQVISIFRLLGVGDEPEKIQNNLIQIGTGEGKSVTLGITCCILALLGVDVSCACYSEYLSQRDYNLFEPLFQTLNVLPYIKYGTFNKICENIINQQGDIRKIVSNTIAKGLMETESNTNNGRPRALLIDEVDVFFSKDFYGNVFTPSASIKDPCISSFLDYLWDSKSLNLTYDKILLSNEFKSICLKFKGWDNLFKEIVKDLIHDLKHFKDQQYIVTNNKIGYKDQDNVVFNVKYGYQTLFAYYHEHNEDNISADSLNDNKSLTIKCGAFSYSEIPTKFQLILGVTGTLKTLNVQEKLVVEKEYKILRKTYTPSVFGANNLMFNEKQDIIISNQDDYFNDLNQEIGNRLEGNDGTKRVVLVFFESKEKLNDFLNSGALGSRRDIVRYLTEEAQSTDKEIIIRNSTISGQVTLLTRSFGRGTDFRGRDQIVLNNGGIHVISTFLPEDVSEEIQIKGRTARQGEQGSFSMVLLDNSLEKFLITKEDIDNNKGDYYHILNQKRNTFQLNQYKGNTDYIQSTKKLHQESQMFLSELFKKNKDKIKPYLVKFNQGNPIPNQKPVKTLVLMDITQSMGNLIANAKNTVQIMFERVGAILQNNGVEEGRVMIQIAGYRNYNSRVEHLFVNSSWESKADNLRSFLATLKAELGWGEEAIEIGLQHANEENAKDPISQVILIGDAICNPYSETLRCRKERFGEAYWRGTRFPYPTNDDKEIQKLKDAKVKVHSFYVADKKNVRDCFQKYASATGGRFQFLDVNSEAGAQVLTDLVTEEILRSVGTESGKGDEFVAQYRIKFGKSYT